ncbi:hypothetical protein ACONUD_02145 [Microbulbifer harenosus]|uniref:Uncharacterized protein n=1 Tax=Microbulbifer harenosus TaxID=2576840 RepID=A0ABY2URC8_9GAMM|nr:hypothetical protein [Microbulbifer harenosus]TLM79683.1 hypothetical protein FDY93_02130 [Microbulbifer harenosus]
MSGRKKNRRPQHGQPPHELLRELNSLRELLGSDMEADIPLLDQVADASANQKTSTAQHQNGPSHAAISVPGQTPRPPQRPLTEQDLPILFSPVDEEPLDEFDDYTSALSEADLELLRPLRDLPPRAPQHSESGRQEPHQHAAATQEAKSNSQGAERRTPADNSKESVKDQAQPAETPQGEHQPGLFETEQEEAPAGAGLAESAPAVPAVKPMATTEQTTVPTATQTPLSPKVSTATMTENPFLPPHIRARLTGGRIPRPEPMPVVQPAAPTKTEVAQTSHRTLSDDERARLLEQLVAEQLPELERHLRLGIGMMLDELYPKKS